MKIHILLPYPQAKTQLYLWAKQEDQIDFRFDKASATRCTLAFAATELIHYLKALGHQVSFGYSEQTDAYQIFLSTESTGDDEAYSYLSSDRRLTILGRGRAGVLYGVYDFLRLQGIQWLEPECEYLPSAPAKELAVPEETHNRQYSMSLGRGFDFEGLLKESQPLYLWMARNGLNLSAYRPHTAKLQKKLCMSFKMGGHIFENILNPDRIAEDGRCFWEAHRDWYGKPAAGVQTKQAALSIQFCMSNGSLLQFLGAELVRILQTDWYEADRIDVWTFDTWGKSCQCEACRALGNATDQTLHLLSAIRAAVDESIRHGALDHDVRLVMCAYEGTLTLEPAVHGIPENLKNSKDYMVYYPINRCYHHGFYDDACPTNQRYQKALSAWKDIPVMLGEYYNVSKLEDLPLLFAHTMPCDIAGHRSLGVTGMTFMHLPMVEWSFRNLTFFAYAALCRDIHTDFGTLIKQYLSARYGRWGDAMAPVYSQMEEAWTYATSYRSWHGDCILSRLQSWDGKTPSEPLSEEIHLLGHAKEIAQSSIERMDSCIAKLRSCRKERLLETELSYTEDPVLRHLDEDIRLAVYGRNVMKLTLLFLLYHDALYLRQSTERLWEEIDQLAEAMVRQYMPLRFESQPENLSVYCDDTLKRSQLKDLYLRCLKVR